MSIHDLFPYHRSLVAIGNEIVAERQEKALAAPYGWESMEEEGFLCEEKEMLCYMEHSHRIVDAMGLHDLIVRHQAFADLRYELAKEVKDKKSARYKSHYARYWFHMRFARFLERVSDRNEEVAKMAAAA